MKVSKDLVINSVLTVLYAIFTLIVVFHHEIWADEAQVWQLCRHLSLVGLFQHLTNEGHPAFFYLLNMPFAKLGFSAMPMQLICWLSSCLAVFLLLQFSSFNRFAKFAIVMSAGFLYFFPVIARSYSLLPIMVFLLAIFYPKSDKHPYIYASLLFLTANTHVIMLVFVEILGCLFVYENIFVKWKQLEKQDKINFFSSAFIIFFGIFLVWLQLHGTLGSNSLIKIRLENIPYNIFSTVIKFFVNNVDASYSEVLKLMLPDSLVLTFLTSVFLYLSFFVTLFFSSRKMFLVAFCGIFFQFFIYVVSYHYVILVPRVFSSHLIFLFAFWIVLSQKDVNKILRNIINITVAIFFLITTINGLKSAILDIRYNDSGAKVTAQFIEKNINKDNSLIISDNAPYCISLIYYLDGAYNIFSARHKQNIKYVVWDSTLMMLMSGNKWTKYIEYMRAQDSQFRTKKIYAVISTFNTDVLKVGQLTDFKMIYQSPPNILKYEGYRVYEYMK